MNDLTRYEWRLRLLKRKQYDIMPFIKNKQINERINELTQTCEWLKSKPNSQHVERRPKNWVSIEIKHRLMAKSWLKQDKYFNLPDLKNRIDCLVSIVLIKLKKTSTIIDHEQTAEVHYLKKHHANHLALSAFEELKYTGNYVVATIYNAYCASDYLQEKNYYEAYIHYWRSLRLIKLAK